jgi:hypothetical protein
MASLLPGYPLRDREQSNGVNRNNRKINIGQGYAASFFCFLLFVFD